jgi:hypothetical protein
MNVRDRFRTVFAGGRPDRLPRWEWATWWNQTIERWTGEGLPQGLDHAGIKRHFGLDVDHQFWFGLIDAGAPRQAGVKASGHDRAWIVDADGYEALRPWLYRQRSPFPNTAEKQRWAAIAAEQAAGDAVVRVTIPGFFWFARELLGIEPHLYALVDQPELIERINQDLADATLRLIDQCCAIAVPDFMTFAEDMSYNHRPMLSRRTFDRLLAPFYRQVVPDLRRRGITVIVDSDGDVARLAPWLEGVGVQGILPLERQAGCDIDTLQAAHPGMIFIGHFDKLTMTQGEAAMRAEFERLLPAMRRGRFLPSVDHQTPPGVSLAQYRNYRRLLDEYTERACR